MACNEALGNRVREALVDQPLIEEKKMFSGICFMVNGKMCICVTSNGLLCRIGVNQAVLELENHCCRQMINNGRLMKDYVYVEDTHIQSGNNLSYWVGLCLKFNPQAKSSKKPNKYHLHG
jgi:TfoX/Sxy family transcriptional regulator of competence genes